jgi:hypothetical protein
MIFDTMATSQRTLGLIRSPADARAAHPRATHRVANNDSSARSRASRTQTTAFASPAKIIIVKQSMKKETTYESPVCETGTQYRALLRHRIDMDQCAKGDG